MGKMQKLIVVRCSAAILGMGLLGTLGGCTVDTTDPAGGETASEEFRDASETLVAKVHLSDGQTLGWYEPEPGSLLVGRSFVLGSEVPKDFSEAEAQAMPPSELYDLIVSRVPQEDSPEARAALVAAEARQAEVAEAMKDVVRSTSEPDDQGPIVNEASDSLPSISPASSDVRQKKLAAVDDAWPWDQFKNLQACWRGNSWGIEWSYSSGDNWFRRVDNYKVFVAAGSYSGTISYRVRKSTWSWETPVSVSLSAGNGWEWSSTAGAFDFDVESTVSNAAGDGFHHCGHGTR